MWGRGKAQYVPSRKSYNLGVCDWWLSWAKALVESLDKPFPWAVGFLFGNTQLSLELWNVIDEVSGLDD